MEQTELSGVFFRPVEYVAIYKLPQSVVKIVVVTSGLEHIFDFFYSSGSDDMRFLRISRTEHHGPSSVREVKVFLRYLAKLYLITNNYRIYLQDIPSFLYTFGKLPGGANRPFSPPRASRVLQKKVAAAQSDKNQL